MDEEFLKSALTTNVLKPYGRAGGGCISKGCGYTTDHGSIFVKSNPDAGAKIMFDGEFAGLTALYATMTVKVPKPIKSLENPQGGAVLITEYVDMTSLGNNYASLLGRQLAQLHLHNMELCKEDTDRAAWFRECDDEDFSCAAVSKFGFPEITCCGFLPLNNDWKDDWIEFLTDNRLEPQIDRLLEKNKDRELKDLWSKLKPEIPKFFRNCGVIVPSLLHGDLWGGNVAQTDSGPIIFDPATFYGHSEFELGIATMFGGFPDAFFKSYHDLIPKSPDYEDRLKLYQLFHYLNHWNHFGGGYRASSISLMKKLLNPR